MNEVIKAHDPQQRITELSNVLRDVDGFAQSAFSEIGAIARLALLAMETPKGHVASETLAQAFSAIWGIAENIGHTIKGAVEDQDCACDDEPQERRATARSIAARGAA